MLAGLFLAAGLVFSSMLGTSAWVKIKNSQFITVKGSARKNIDSDLAVWRGSFVVEAESLVDAQHAAKENRDKVLTFLAGANFTNAAFTPIGIEEVRAVQKNADGFTQQHTAGYRLSQSVRVESADVERIQKLVPKENLLILFFEDFFSSPAKNFGQVLNFLGLPEWPIKIEAHNTAIEWRFDFLRKILVNQGPLMQRGIARISRFFRSRGININKIFLQGVTKKGNAAKIDDVTKEMLKGIFADDVKDLFSCLTPPSHKKWEYTNSIDFKPQLIEARRRLLMREIPKSTGISWAR